MKRTKNQTLADEFDCDLYRLMVRAERMAGDSVPVERAKWNAALMQMRNVRFHIRQLMHKDDIATTA